jgi:uncharacterized protein YciI
MNFVVIGRDHTDADTLSRRMAVREAHLERVAPMKASGKIIFVAALKNDEGNMCGSMMFFEIGSKDEIIEWLKNEPYIQNDVWETYEIQEVALPASK